MPQVMQLPAITVKAFPHTQSGTISYVLHNTSSKVAAIIDSVLDFEIETCTTKTDSVEKIIQDVNLNQLKVKYILETHVHADHLSGAQHLKKVFPDALLSIGKRVTETQKSFKKLYNIDIIDDGSQFDKLFEDGEEIWLGEVKGSVIFTPGHTADSVSYHIGDCVFVGDTLFKEDSGTARCDFPSGSSSLLFDSMQRILSLPENTREEFIKKRNERDATLPYPKLIIPSIQFNIQAGKALIDNENTPFLKLPMNQAEKFTHKVKPSQ